MKKKDLKTGMKIVTREAKGYIVFLDTGLEDNPNDIVLGSDGWNELDSYDDNLININKNTEFDVLKIYKPRYAASIRRTLNFDFSHPNDWILIWERDDSKNKQIEQKIKELEKELNDLKVDFYSKFK